MNSAYSKALLLVSSSLLVTACSACSSSSDAPGVLPGAGAGGESAGQGGGGAAGETAGGAGGSGQAGSAGAAPSHDCPEGLPVIPNDLPEGWVPWTEYSCELPVFLATKSADLPRVEWEDCDAAASVPCRRVKVVEGHLSGIASVVMTAHGERRRIAFERGVAPPDGDASKKWIYFVLAELDGPVLAAAATPYAAPEGLLADIDAVSEGEAIIRFEGANAGDDVTAGVSLTQGAVVLSPESLELVERFKQIPRCEWWMGERFLYKACSDQKLWAYPRDGAERFLIASSAEDREGLQIETVTPVGDTVFIEQGNLRRQSMMVWDEEKGLRDFLRWEDDTGAYHFGTDGTDMAWTYGEDHEAGEGGYLTRSVQTAKFTSDEFSVEPRTLGSDPTTGLSYTFTVGCGYAGHFSVGYGPAAIRIHRLSDGREWEIRENDWLNEDGMFRPYRVVAITCDEVFLQFGHRIDGKLVGNLARIKISDLGPGNPAQ